MVVTGYFSSHSALQRNAFTPVLKLSQCKREGWQLIMRKTSETKEIRNKVINFHDEVMSRSFSCAVHNILMGGR